MPYYAAMTTAGSLLGCFVLYGFAWRGGEVFLRKRFSGAARRTRHGALSAPRSARRDRAVAAAAADAVQAVRAAGRRRARCRPGSSAPRSPSAAASAISARDISRCLYGEAAVGAGARARHGRRHRPRRCALCASASRYYYVKKRTRRCSVHRSRRRVDGATGRAEVAGAS